MAFKDKLRSLRKSRRMLQREIADVLGYGYTTIANYEAGRNEPNIEDLKRIADLFQISMDELVERDFGLPKEEEEKLLEDYLLLSDKQKSIVQELIAEFLKNGVREDKKRIGKRRNKNSEQ